MPKIGEEIYSERQSGNATYVYDKSPVLTEGASVVFVDKEMLKRPPGALKLGLAGRVGHDGKRVFTDAIKTQD